MTGPTVAPAKTPLDALRAASPDRFAEVLGGVFEHAPWVAEAAASRRPFATVTELFAAMRRAVEEAGRDRQLALLRGHPELAGAAARSGNMTAESVGEQAIAGLSRLSAERAALFDALNGRYRDRHGIPFVVCVRRHGTESLLATFRRRVEAETEAEIATALAEVFRIAALRVHDAVEGPGPLPVHGRLSTHVLDTANGRPAEGVAVTLHEIGPDGEREVARASTDAGGRTPPLVAGRPVPIATYELRFGLGAYFRAAGATLAEPAFLDVVPVRFAVAEPEGHYHVPLTATPWSYATYRGS